MSKRNLYIPAAILVALLLVSGLFIGGQSTSQAQTSDQPPASKQELPAVLKDMPEDMKINHAKYDNRLTALFEQWLAGEKIGSDAGASSKAPNSAFSPLYGVDVDMSTLTTTENEYQIDINPLNSMFAIGSSNDGMTAGVGIYRTSDSGLTWTSVDASFYGVPAACCDPAVAYASDGSVYVGILDTSPAGQYTLYSTDNGATFVNRGLLPLPDRNNIATDPSNPNIVYTTYSDLGGGGSNRIKGYRSTDRGVTWGTSFFVGDAGQPLGYQQSSQPQVASNGTLYVGYQEYVNSSQGCNAGVTNEVAKSTDGGATFTHTVFPITQGGACTPAQAGRGIFCINAGGSSFRSRSFPVLAIHPTNPNIVYLNYTGGDQETPYTCGTATGFHSDMLFRKSTDGGATFSPATKINDDPVGKDQYYGWIDVAPNGTLWAGWHDRREDTNNFMHKWYQSFSTDEGATWRKLDGAIGNDPVADIPSQPSTFIGDYAGIAAKNDLVLGMWWDARADPYTDPQLPPAQGTPTPTVTGTPPTATPTRTVTVTSTRTNTAIPSPTSCGPGGNYSITGGSATIVPGTVNIGSLCDDCTTSVTLPFPVTLYGQSFTSAAADSNGTLQFGGSPISIFTNTCLPSTGHTAAVTIFAYWDDLRTDGTGCTGGCGIFTSVSGTAPNRIFNIEWRTTYFSGGGTANFEIRLYETTPSQQFDIIYGLLSQNNTGTGGVQLGTGGSRMTQDFCNAVPPSTLRTYTLPGCPTGTPATSTITPTSSGGTPTCVPGGPVVINGALTASDPDQTGRIFRDDPESTCALPQACATFDATPKNYDVYTFTNTSGAPVCVTIEVNAQTCVGTQFIQSAVYSPVFVPTALCTNFVGDVGASPNPVKSYSVTIAAGAQFQVTVNEVTGGALCPAYTLTITGLPGGGGCPTGTPATATRTNTAVPPTLTSTRTATSGATATCVPGGGSGYTITTSSATMIPGGTRVDGAGCDDCTTNVTLPFPVTVYGTPATSVDLGSNGNAQFTTGNPKLFFWDGCLPIAPTQGGPYERTLFLYNDDLRTDEATACPTCGIFTQTIGTAPNRQFVVRWRTTYFNHGGTAEFEMVLTEGSPVLRVIYGASDNNGAEATSGIQRNLTDFNQYSCDTATLTNGLSLTYTPAGGGCPSTATATRTNTVGPINTATRTNTPVPTSTRTSTATATLVPCTIQFIDVPPGHTFYENVRCLACRGIISGYADGTFRPNNPVTRGQLAKMVSNAAGFTENPNPQIFADVPPSHTFYDFINRLTRRGHMTGYACGGPGEPCINNMPYFRPFANATRGQTSKIVSNAAGFTEPPVGQTFEDVPPTHTFYEFIQRLASRNVMQGYACGGAFEPCVPPANRPYFRPGNDVTRGQSAKIVANTFFPGCVTP